MRRGDARHVGQRDQHRLRAQLLRAARRRAAPTAPCPRSGSSLWITSIAVRGEIERAAVDHRDPRPETASSPARSTTCRPSGLPRNSASSLLPSPNRVDRPAASRTSTRLLSRRSWNAPTIAAAIDSAISAGPIAPMSSPTGPSIRSSVVRATPPPPPAARAARHGCCRDPERADIGGVGCASAAISAGSSILVSWLSVTTAVAGPGAIRGDRLVGPAIVERRRRESAPRSGSARADRSPPCRCRARAPARPAPARSAPRRRSAAGAADRSG